MKYGLIHEAFQMFHELKSDSFHSNNLVKENNEQQMPFQSHVHEGQA